MGKAKRAGIDLEFDLKDGYYALGFAQGLASGISSKYYLSSVIEYAYSMMSNDFNAQMAAVAQTKPWAFHHVYEPNHVGVPGMELWRNKLYGRGDKRQASFEWQISKLPIVKPEERAQDRNDPMSKIDDDIIEKLSDEDYVFRMRAPIMEYGLTTVITPRPGTKALFIPTFASNPRRSGNRKEGYTWSTQNYRFEKHNVPDWNYRNPQEPSKKGTTVGQFTKQWIGFWSGGGAQSSWDSHVKRGLEGGLDDWGKALGKKVSGNRAKRYTAQIFSFKDAYAAEESGRNLAQAYIKGKARSFSSAAKWIDKNGVFGEDRRI